MHILATTVAVMSYPIANKLYIWMAVPRPAVALPLRDDIAIAKNLKTGMHVPATV